MPLDTSRSYRLVSSNAPMNVKPHLPPPGHRWGFVQLVGQRTRPMGNYFLQCPPLDSPNTLGQRGDLYLYYAI